MNEAELLFTEILNCDRLTLYEGRRTHFKKDKSAFVAWALKRRIRGEPLQYILGKTEFMGLEFKVDKDVMLPRPETEILVEKVIKIVQSSQSGVQSILDLGTGSGCIAISLAKFLPNTNITATDISESAIEIARQNAIINNVKIKFLCSNLFNNYELRTTNYELIISNPPYIPSDEIATLQPEIKFEPRMALDGGREGLDFYHKIIAQAQDYLKEEGLLILEIGFNQREPVKKLFQRSRCFKVTEVIKDYNNRDRVVVARKVEKDG